MSWGAKTIRYPIPAIPNAYLPIISVSASGSIGTQTSHAYEWVSFLRRESISIIAAMSWGAKSETLILSSIGQVDGFLAPNIFLSKRQRNIKT